MCLGVYSAIITTITYSMTKECVNYNCVFVKCRKNQQTLKQESFTKATFLRELAHLICLYCVDDEIYHGI